MLYILLFVVQLNLFSVRQTVLICTYMYTSPAVPNVSCAIAKGLTPNDRWKKMFQIEKEFRGNSNK